jgi:hypothetical protein
MKTSHLPYPALIVATFALFACNADSSPNSKESGGYNAMADSIARSPLSDEKGYTDGIATKSNKNNRYQAEQKLKDGEEIDEMSYLSNVFSSSAARMNRLDSTHRFIRTGNVRFRVTNVAMATYAIEDITNRFGGWVADTKLSSDMVSLSQLPVSADSSLETMRYVVNNTITLRVPAKKLDTVMKMLVPLIDYLDYRNINTNDITLNVLSNQLAQVRLAKYSNRLANDIDNKGKKLPDVQSAEESILLRQEQSDNSLIENLRLDDQVQYSTVTVQIYQRETIRQELIKRERPVEAYEAGLGKRLGESFMTGWRGLRAFLAFFVMLWPLWVASAAAWFTTKWFLKRKKIS